MPFTPGAKIFLEPMNGFELYLAREIVKKKAAEAPVAKASSFSRIGLTPIAAAAISSSRIAIQARPMRESLSLMLVAISRATSATPT